MITIDDILKIRTDEEFESAALELFRFQAAHCAPYREYVELMGIDPADIRRANEIPHLPISIFKSREVYCGAGEPEKVFTSSTTGGDTPSKHYMSSLEDYRKTFRAAFAAFYGAPEDWSFYALLPCYLEREGSSLVCMADDLIKSGGGGFYLDDYENLLRDMAADPRPKILLGVSYALWDLAEMNRPLPEGTVVMETGGMKGRREELPKEEFHRLLTDAFRVDKIHSEYGMAELTSQAYSAGEGIFRAPAWVCMSVRDLNDPLEILGSGRTGALNITDLANIHSCAFIATQDLAQIAADGSFSILGRVDRSQMRGCNLLVQ